jgi:hypothetical protein
MPIVSLDGPIFSGLAWAFQLPPSKHKNQHMALWAIHQCILENIISSHKDNKG